MKNAGIKEPFLETMLGCSSAAVSGMKKAGGTFTLSPHLEFKSLGIVVGQRDESDSSLVLLTEMPSACGFLTKMQKQASFPETTAAVYARQQSKVGESTW